MNTCQEKLINIGKDYFESILPSLRDISEPAVNNILSFISTSVAYGYCDEHSDVDMEVFINTEIDGNVRQKINDIFSESEDWHKSIRISCGLAFDYWKFDLLLKNDMATFWEKYNPYALYNIKHAIPVWDPSNLLPRIRKRVNFYPNFTLKKAVRGLWITATDSGEYNVDQAAKRNTLTEGHMFLYKATEAVLRLIYILNGEYYPPSKWITSGLDKLENEFGVKDFLNELQKTSSLSEKHKLFCAVHQNIRKHLIEHEVIEKESIENYGTIFQKPYYIFHPF